MVPAISKSHEHDSHLMLSEAEKEAVQDSLPDLKIEIDTYGHLL